MRNLLHEEKGSSIILLVLVLGIFAGISVMVTQGGAVYYTKAKLQDSVDAAALAGAQDLAAGKDWTTAQNDAISYAAKNGVEVFAVDVTQYPVSGTITGINVKASKSLSYFLPNILASGSGVNLVDAEATAQVQVVTSMSGLVPVVAMDDEIQYGTEVLLKGGSKDKFASTGPSGFRGLLSLDGANGSAIGGVFENGCTQVVTVGGASAYIDTQNGTVSSIESGVNSRINACPHYPKCTIDHYEDPCPRLVYVPVVRTTVINGVDTVVVNGGEVETIGFAAFLLSGITGSGNDAQIRGTFIQALSNSTGSSPTATSYGVKTVKLIN